MEKERQVIKTDETWKRITDLKTRQVKEIIRQYPFFKYEEIRQMLWKMKRNGKWNSVWDGN